MDPLTSRFKDLPIRRKIVFAIMLVSVAVALFVCVAFFVSEFIGLRRAAARQIDTLGKIVAANTTAALVFDNPTDAQELLEALRADGEVEAAAIYDAKGALFAKFPNDPAAVFPAAPAAAGHRFEGGWLSGFEPVVLSGKPLGTVYIRYSLGAVNERLWLYAGIVAVMLGVTFVVSYSLSGLLERMISQPVVALAKVARSVSEKHDYSIRAAETPSRDEIGDLTAAFNRMLAELQVLKDDLEIRVEERTRQLQDANRELEAFSYSVSHDLRAPLRHIHGFINLLENHSGGTMDEKSRRFTETISRAAKQMGRLIDDLLAFSRIGRADIHTVAVDHDSLVERVIRENAFNQGERQVTWKIARLPNVTADPGLLRLVWMNLIDNAVKYSGKSAAPRVEIGSIQGPDDAREQVFFIRDNGVGFDMKYAGKLFGVFQRLHGPSEFEGTGIGLANVQRIVHRHGGRVWADSKPGEGATFYFSLPIKSPQAPVEPRPAPVRETAHARTSS